MMRVLESFGAHLRVIVIGANGGIGRSFVKQLADFAQVDAVFALNRNAQARIEGKVHHMPMNFADEESIKLCAEDLSEQGQFDMILIATGFLHEQGVGPEKSMKAMNREHFLKSFEINTIGPALCAKHFLPLLRRDAKTVFAALSARVGSISDNRLGGWYAYRASKAALNMVIKTLSIEFARRYPEAIICGLHPGTVETALSQPFQANVAEDKLFTPAFSAMKMIAVLDDLCSESSGYIFAWDGKKIDF